MPQPRWFKIQQSNNSMMRQKYVVSNIPEEFYVEDTQLQLL